MSTQEMIKEQKSGSMKKAVVAGVLACTLAIGGVFAYLTATDTVTNNLSVATDLSIEVVEPGWHEADAQDMLPGATVTKDPKIVNTSGVDAWAVAEVKVPVVDGQELYTLNNIPAAWQEQDSAVVADGVATHTFFYNGTLAANGETPAIFDSVTLYNFDSGFIGEGQTAQQIVVTGHAIQKSAFDTVSAAWSQYQTDQAAKAESTSK